MGKSNGVGRGKERTLLAWMTQKYNSGKSYDNDKHVAGWTSASSEGPNGRMSHSERCDDGWETGWGDTSKEGKISG